MPSRLVKSLIETNHRLEEELARLRSEVSERESEILRLKASIRDLEQANANLSIALKSAEDRIKRLESELKEHSERLEKLRKTPGGGPFLTGSNKPLAEPSLGELLLKEKELKERLKELGETV